MSSLEVIKVRPPCTRAAAIGLCAPVAYHAVVPDRPYPRTEVRWKGKRGVPSLTLALSQSAIERIILDPRYQDVLSVVKGARNGAVYGSKVRFPHALV